MAAWWACAPSTAEALEVRAPRRGRRRPPYDVARKRRPGVEDLGAPMDVLWFSLPRDASPATAQSGGYVRRGLFFVTFNRGDYWQCGYVIAKGTPRRSYGRRASTRSRQVAKAAPFLADRVAHCRTGRIEAPHGAGEPHAALVPRGLFSSAMPRTRCRPWAASASTWRSRTRSLR